MSFCSQCVPVAGGCGGYGVTHEKLVKVLLARRTFFVGARRDMDSAGKAQGQANLIDLLYAAK